MAGEMGAAVQSHWFSVGSVVTWAEPGVGLVATQSFANPEFGPRGLLLLKSGREPRTVAGELLQDDPDRERRQLAVMDIRGRGFAFTGEGCIPEAGHIVEENYSVHANLMETSSVWPSMAEAFEKSGGPLAERMLASLNAGEAAGGDIRGCQSAALLVVKIEPSGNQWADRMIDLRVEDSRDPLKELDRLLRIHRGYEHMELGEQAMNRGDYETSHAEYRNARRLCPDNEEMTFWHFVALANSGRKKEADALLGELVSPDRRWHILSRRLQAQGLLTSGAAIPEE